MWVPSSGLGRSSWRRKWQTQSSTLAWEILQAFIPPVLLFCENGPRRCWWSLPIFRIFQKWSPELPKSPSVGYFC